MAGEKVPFGRVANLVGCTIYFNADDEKYKATVLSVNPLTNRLVMKDVYLISDDGSKNHLPGIITFSGDEVSDIKYLELSPRADADRSETKKPPRSLSDKSECRISSASNSADVLTGVTLQSPESKGASIQHTLPENDEGGDPQFSFSNQFFFRDDELTNDDHKHQRPNRFVIIANISDEFFEAISIIENERQIGCGIDGVFLGRNGRLSWIQFATTEYVFMFDMVLMDCADAFINGISGILESPSILKIIHDCRQASDLLFHHFDIHLVNVYDTQVADIMVLRMANLGRTPKYVRSLRICLTEYLCFTQEQISFYSERKAALERDYQIWHYRPLPDFLLEAIALNVRYLRELRQATLRCMLEDFTYGVDIFLHCVRDKDPLGEHNGKRLPEEFKELDYRWLSRFNGACSQDHCCTIDSQDSPRVLPSTSGCEITLDDKNWVDSYLPELEEIPPKEFERNDDYNSDENSLPFHVSFPKLSHDVMSNYQPKSLDKELSVGVSPLLSKHSSVSPSVSSGSINRIKSLSEVTNDESPHFLPNDSSRVLPLTATNLKLLPAGIALCHNKKK